MRSYILVGGMLIILLLAGCGAQKNIDVDETANGSTDILTGSMSGNVIGDSITTGDSNPTGDEVQPPLSNTGGIAGEYTFLFSGTNTETLRIHHPADERTKIYFINADATSMHVTITFPDGPANFRLNQIIMPDGQMDGPFGTDTIYELNQFGGYQLIFHESMMAGDPWTGDAVITVELMK